MDKPVPGHLVHPEGVRPKAGGSRGHFCGIWRHKRIYCDVDGAIFKSAIQLFGIYGRVLNAIHGSSLRLVLDISRRKAIANVAPVSILRLSRY